jgi:hypothetical protein
MALDEDVASLKASDVMMQRGSNHACMNGTNEPGCIAFVRIFCTPKREGSI